MEDTKETEEKRIQILKATAVRQAMVEVVGEYRTEIIKRAMAKLTAMGVAVEESELGMTE